MAQYVARLHAGLRVRPFARSGLFLAQMVAIGLLVPLAARTRALAVPSPDAYSPGGGPFVMTPQPK